MCPDASQRLIMAGGSDMRAMLSRPPPVPLRPRDPNGSNAGIGAALGAIWTVHPVKAERPQWVR